MSNSDGDSWTGSTFLVKGAKHSNASKDAHSHIGLGCSVKGSVEFSGVSRVDGKVEGDILSSGELSVGESGVVYGNISTDKVRVFGEVLGDIVCASSLELCSGAKIRGNISSPSVIIEDGVLFEGHCSMICTSKEDLSDKNDSSLMTSSDKSYKESLEDYS